MRPDTDAVRGRIVFAHALVEVNPGVEVIGYGKAQAQVVAQVDGRLGKGRVFGSFIATYGSTTW